MKAGIMISETVLAKDQWKFLTQWSFFNLLGWGIGYYFATAVLFYMDAHTRGIEILWGAMLFFFLFGGSVGVLQWFEFRKFRINIFKWTFLTALGWSVGCSICIWAMSVIERNSTNWFYNLITMSIVGVILSGTIIGNLQLVMIRKFILRPILWTRAYIFGLLIPTVFAYLIFFVKSFLKKILFSLVFLPPQFLSEIISERWTLVLWFSIVIASLGTSILTGRVLLKQLNKTALPRLIPQKTPYTAKYLLETLQGNFTNFFKQRGTRIGLICSVCLLALSFLLYFGYCRGWWGHSSLLLQYYFQCKCPSGSEKARYPKEVEILVSPCSCPCNYHYVKLSPSGRFLYFYEDKSGDIKTSLLDLETGQQTPTQPITNFVTDEIAYTWKPRELIDISTQQQYPIQSFRDLQPNAYSDDMLNQQILVDTLKQAKKIYMVDAGSIIVLMSESPTNMEKNFIFNILDEGNRLESPFDKFLADNSIRYTATLYDFATQAVSPDGRFIARNDGIYLATTDQKIVEGVPRLFVRGWVSDSSGAIYTSMWDEPCWPGSSIEGVYSSCEFQVTQPVIKLKVPEMYMVLH